MDGYAILICGAVGIAALAAFVAFLIYRKITGRCLIHSWGKHIQEEITYEPLRQVAFEYQAGYEHTKVSSYYSTCTRCGTRKCVRRTRTDVVKDDVIAQYTKNDVKESPEGGDA